MPVPSALPGLLLFASGFAGLVYQVLWMRELGRLFGNDAQAVATTLAAFFLGIALGSHVVGRRVAALRRPLRVYAWLELGLAASALLYFAILDAYAAVYAPLYARLGASPGAFLAVKFALALTALLPPAFFMGGTLPAMSQHLVRGAEALGRTASGLYAVNTLGAALGAWLTGFELIRRLGVDGAYALAISTSLGVAAVAAWAARAEPPAGSPAAAALGPTADGGAARGGMLGRASLATAAFASGFATLALEVLWTRMFAQVLQNSVYTFALVLAVFLVALAAGAWTARVLMRRVSDPVAGLAGLLLAAGVGVAASPWIFAWRTGGLDYVGGESAWSGYVLGATATTALVLLPPGLLVGSVFPFLLRSAQELRWSAGRAVGETAALNTLGAVAGSLTAGFVLLDALGLWPSLRLLAAGYAAAALGVAARRAGPRPLLATVSALLLVALATRIDPAAIPRVRVDAGRQRERVVEVIEGSGGTVAVIERGSFLRLKLDNHYGLGGTTDLEQEQLQATLPIVLHPRPRSAFFLGLGSGITAGAALRHPLERIVVAEISPEVVDAARRHFRPWLHGLFDDPRAAVLAEDGRNVLQGTRERFDLVVADLFMPWLAGAGSLYSVEAFRAGRERLEPGGLYAQWLALFQLSSDEFATIARTMAEVFPQLTLWRGNFRGSRPIALLLGSVDAPPLDPDAVRAGLEALLGADAAAASPLAADPAQVLLLYQGNLALAPDALGPGPIERDSRPRGEYQAAIAQRDKRAGRVSALVESEMIELFDRIFERAPPGSDPFLARVEADRRELPRAGLDQLRAGVLERAGDREGAARARASYAAAWTRAFPSRGISEPRAPESPPGDEKSSADLRKNSSETPAVSRARGTGAEQ